jgi:succinate-semialdehyde dehydrogenase/glutarate-semialdehyde dehydrogenase
LAGHLFYQIKAPAETPLTALALAELAHQAEFPAGVFNIVTTQSATPEIGKALCESQEIRKLSFTGSVSTCFILFFHDSKWVTQIIICLPWHFLLGLNHL